MLLLLPPLLLLLLLVPVLVISRGAALDFARPRELHGQVGVESRLLLGVALGLELLLGLRWSLLRPRIWRLLMIRVRSVHQ